MTDLRTRAERLIVTTEAAGLLPTATTIRDLLSEWDKATSQRDSLLAQFVGHRAQHLSPLQLRHEIRSRCEMAGIDLCEGERITGLELKGRAG